MASDLDFGDFSSQMIQAITGTEENQDDVIPSPQMNSPTKDSLETSNCDERGTYLVSGDKQLPESPSAPPKAPPLPPAPPSSPVKLRHTRAQQMQQVVTIDDEEKADLNTSSEFKRKASVKTVNLPKDFGLQLNSILKTQQNLLLVSQGVESKLGAIDERMDEIGNNMRSLLEVYKAGQEQTSNRIVRMGTNLRKVECEVMKLNSIRHESNQEILGIKVDNVSSCLADFEGTLQEVKVSSELAREGLDAVRVMEARLAGIEVKITKDSTLKFNASVQEMSPAVIGIDKSSWIPAVSAPLSKRKSVQLSESVFTTPRGSKRTKIAQDAVEESLATLSIGIEEYEGDTTMTYACRFAMVKKSTKGSSNFDRKCLFMTTHLSLMVSHRNYHGNHGTILLDGKTVECDHRLEGKTYTCTKTTLKGVECGYTNTANGQFNRHSRNVLHREDVFILNRKCFPCGMTFSSDLELFIHVTSSSKCEHAKGSFGIDSKDLSCSGYTCRSCGRSDFKDPTAVYNHQGTGSCKRGSDLNAEQDED